MMGKQTAAHQIKARRGKRQSQGVSCYYPSSILPTMVKMRNSAIQQGQFKLNTALLQSSTNGSRRISCAGGNFQERQRIASNLLRDPHNHGFCGSNAAEPAVNPAQVR